jgi:hypothetical protein
MSVAFIGYVGHLNLSETTKREGPAIDVHVRGPGHRRQRLPRPRFAAVVAQHAQRDPSPPRAGIHDFGGREIVWSTRGADLGMFSCILMAGR